MLTGGMEKILRIFDMNRPDAPPKEVATSPGSIRTVEWLHGDNTILSSSSDTGDIRYCTHHIVPGFLDSLLYYIPVSHHFLSSVGYGT